MDKVALPPVLLSAEKSASFFSRLKGRAAKRFRWTRAEALRDVTETAYWLHVLRRDPKALSVCAFLGQYEFAGNYRLWTQVEFALALRARLLRKQRKRTRAAECVRRMRDVGFTPDRLKGAMLDRNSALRLALKRGDAVAEREARLGRLKELCFIIELGGSKAFPVAEAEADYRQNVARLRELVAADGLATEVLRH